MQQHARTDCDIFVKLKPQEQPFRVRIASNPKHFRSHLVAFRSVSVTAVRSPAYLLDEKGLDIAWAEGDWLPQSRHSCQVFHRDDGDRLKILEGGDTLFSHFGNWYKKTGVNPSSDKGTDWFIWVNNNGGNAEYSATPDINPAPFTEEETNTLVNPPFDIGEIIKRTTPEEIKTMWLRLDDRQKYDPKSRLKAGATFNRDEFEKRYGLAEDAPVVMDNGTDESDNWGEDALPF